MTILELKDVKQLTITDTVVEAVLAGGRIVSYTYAKGSLSRPKTLPSRDAQSDARPAAGRTIETAPESLRDTQADTVFGAES